MTGRDKICSRRKVWWAIQFSKSFTLWFPGDRYWGGDSPWPDSRALVCEAGSARGDHTLRDAGVEPLVPRSNWSTSIHDK